VLDGQLSFDGFPSPPAPPAPRWEGVKFNPARPIWGGEPLGRMPHLENRNCEWWQLDDAGERTGYQVIKMVGLNCPRFPFVVYAPEGQLLGTDPGRPWNGDLERGVCVFRTLKDAQAAVEEANPCRD